jgi:hypothetical protein
MTGAHRRRRALVLVTHGSWCVLVIIFHRFVILPAKSWKALFHDDRRVRVATMKTM